MNESDKIKTSGHFGSKTLGIILIIIGAIFISTVIIPFVGTVVALLGIPIAFAGFGLYAYGSKASDNSD